MQVLTRHPTCGEKGRPYALKGEQSFLLIEGPITGNSPCWEADLAFPFSLCQLVWSRTPTNGAESQALLVLRARRGEVGRQRPGTEEQGRDGETVEATAGTVDA